MVAGQTLPMVNKPSRSDNEVVDPEQELRITHEVRAQYESMVPKRPIKPSRSEPDPDALEVHQRPNSQPIPELQKLMSLKSYQNQQGVLEKEGEGVVQEEFVETEYYKQLVAIDKHHHTTGTGFIKAEKEEVGNGENYEMSSILSENERKIKMEFSFGYKSNPATNDWTPSVEQVEYVSTKPSHSG